MPDKEKNIKQKETEVKQDRKELPEEELQKIMESAISLSELRQCAENNIPYEGYVFGVGKVKYYDMDSDDPFVLIPYTETIDYPIPYRSKEKKDARVDPWFLGGAAFGYFSMYKSFLAFDMHNPWYWKSAKGIRMYEKRLKINVKTGKVIGKSGYEIGRTLASNRAKPLLKTAIHLNYVGLIIPVASTIYKGEINVEDSTDMVFASIAFIPEVGWVIAGLYVVVDTISVATTGKKISTNVKEGINWLNEQLLISWVELNQAIKNWINSMSFGYYPIP
jgi:hypothetical protein